MTFLTGLLSIVVSFVATFVCVILLYLIFICGGYLLLGVFFSKGTSRVTPEQVDRWTNNNM